MSERNDHIVFSFPMERPHCGVPMANGNFGVLVWGRDTLNLTVNQSDLWDHRFGQVLDDRDRYSVLAAYAAEHGCDRGLNALFHRAKCWENWDVPRRLPVGRFEFVFVSGVKPVRARLDYRTGSLSVVLSDGAELLLAVPLKKNVIYVDDPGKRIRQVDLKPASDFAKVREFHQKKNLPPYELLSDGWTIHLPEDPDYTVRAVKTDYGWKVFSNSDGDDSHKADDLNSAAGWWGQVFERTARITVPDPWWNEFYYFNLYKLAAATCPFGKAAGLQGPWHEEYQPAQWSGDFHFNVNVQMMYGPLCQLGLSDHQMPLFDMIETPDFQAALRQNARSLFGVDDALWQTHAVTDRGLQCGGIAAGAVLDPACGAWTALLYYDHFRYTGDLEFLRERAYPYIYGILRGYEEMLDENWNIPVAISAEYASSNQNMTAVAGRNPSYQLAAVRKLASIMIELSALLQRPERPAWRKILEKVPLFTRVGGYDSYSRKEESRIGIWENQDLEVCHRHHSHLGCIWPFDSLPENLSEADRQTVDNSICHWISMGIGKWSEWCIPWANIIYTRMGLREAPMQLFNLWREIFINEGLCTVYLPRMFSLIAHRRHDIEKPRDENEIMQLDGCGGFLDAFAQMCAYARFDTLYLFRGMPEKWKDVAVENLLLPGGGRLFAQRGKNPEIRGGTRKFTCEE